MKWSFLLSIGDIRHFHCESLCGYACNKCAVIKLVFNWDLVKSYLCILDL